jgi:hypothetical protein
MGMYTQLHYGAQLRTDVPAQIVNVLQYMVGESTAPPPTLPEHALFRCDRWVYMLRCDSYYFDYKTTHLLRFDDIGRQWYLNVTSNLKNYDNEIEKFIDWIAPHVDKMPGDFLGYSRYEGEEAPTLWVYPARAVPTSVRAEEVIKP